MWSVSGAALYLLAACASYATAAKILPSKSRFAVCNDAKLKSVAGPLQTRRRYPGGGGDASSVSVQPVYAWPDGNSREVKAAIDVEDDFTVKSVEVTIVNFRHEPVS